MDRVVALYHLSHLQWATLFYFTEAKELVKGWLPLTSCLDLSSLLLVVQDESFLQLLEPVLGDLGEGDVVVRRVDFGAAAHFVHQGQDLGHQVAVGLWSSRKFRKDCFQIFLRDRLAFNQWMAPRLLSNVTSSLMPLSLISLQTKSNYVVYSTTRFINSLDQWKRHCIINMGGLNKFIWFWTRVCSGNSNPFGRFLEILFTKPRTYFCVPGLRPTLLIEPT